MSEMRDQFVGCLLGLAAGEVQLGAPGGAAAGAALGALCVLESFCEQGRLDAYDLADRLRELYQYHPALFDRLERESCRRLAEGYTFERAAYDAWAVMPRSQRQGAGCLPRVVPAGLLRYHDDARLIGESRLVCGLTHYDETCKLACVAFSLAVAHLLMVGTDGLLEEVLEFIAPRNRSLAREINAVRQLQPRDLGPGANVVEALQSALWTALYCDGFMECAGVLQERPGRSPGLGAACGALLGARLGCASVPQRWTEALPQRARLESGALRLYHLAMQP